MHRCRKKRPIQQNLYTSNEFYIVLLIYLFYNIDKVNIDSFTHKGDGCIEFS